MILVGQNVLAQTVLVADTFFTRLKGLLGTSRLPEGQALLIRPCSSVHTFGMRYDIDVLFISHEGQILKIMSKMPPGKIAWCKESAYVIEMPGGTASAKVVRVGDYLKTL